ncbi:MAG TPA: DNA-processing protein DprA [Gemmatimonadaceae bacterium]
MTGKLAGPSAGETQSARDVAPRVWHCQDADFPPALKDMPHPPLAVWTLGDRSVLDAPCVAIVGTREMTGYGERTARRLATAFTRAGACVVSGMARGVDATAHRAALEAGGRTVAVLGTGVDVPYPAGHRHLHAQIAGAGLVVSEEEPGTRARPGCFPRRNRIIAGLARLTIVVEAGLKGGANITAAAADAAHRQVAAVPGPIDAPQSQGCNRLILDGAAIITCVNDALALMGLPQETEERPVLSDREQKIWDVLGSEEAATVELLTARTALPLRETLTALTTLELDGRVAQDFTGTYRRR